jgi:hypothetical protein
MKPIHYLLVIDFTLLAIAIKLIFGSYRVFAKSIEAYFSGNDLLSNSAKKFAEENDCRHKLNLLFASIIVLAGGNLIAFAYIFM